MLNFTGMKSALRFLIFCICIPAAYAEKQTLEAFSRKIYDLCNEAKYDIAIKSVYQYKQTHRTTPEQEVDLFIILSHIHKRVFDYNGTLSYLDSAQRFIEKNPGTQGQLNQIIAEKAYVFFDLSKYPQADSVMNYLERVDYQNIDDYNRGILKMQRGYLAFKKKKYAQADSLYQTAIEYFNRTAPENLPMIYGKQIELFAATSDFKRMKAVCDVGILSAEKYNIPKYKLYLYEMMRKGYEDNGQFQNALTYFRLWSDLEHTYDKEENLSKIKSLELRLEAGQKDKEILRQKEIASNALFQRTLFAGILLLSTTIVLIIIIQRRREEANLEIQRKQAFTKQLFENTEAEKRRIAQDLHDGISNELLRLKHEYPETAGKTDYIINEVQQLSRNLHPAKFEILGLKIVLETFLDRIESIQNFAIFSEIEYQANTLSINQELHLYRIIQEAINNIIKHANANSISLRLLQSQSEISLNIFDNGNGFDIEKTLNAPTAFGLHNIVERVQILKGTVLFLNNSPGTQVQISIPV